VDRRLQQLLDAADVGLGLGRQVLEVADSGGIGAPAGELLIDGLGAGEDGGAGRKVPGDGPVQAIGGTDLNALELVEDVEAGEGASNQPQRRGRPVVAPYSQPRWRRMSPSPPTTSVGMGPLPTRVQ